jgi:hypothetical protein
LKENMAEGGDIALAGEGEAADGEGAPAVTPGAMSSSPQPPQAAGGRSRGGNKRSRRDGDGGGSRRSGKRPRLQLKSFSRDDFVDTEQTDGPDGFGLEQFASARDPDFLFALSCACEDNKATWANLSYTGPALRYFNGFASLLPCSNPVCTKVSFRGAQGGSPAGGSKMFCLLRFCIDPEHVQPAQHTANMMRALNSGPAIRKLASTLHKTISDKQALHNWDMSRLHELGVMERVSELGERGDATPLMRDEAVAEHLQNTPSAGALGNDAGPGIAGGDVVAAFGAPAPAPLHGSDQMPLHSPYGGTGDQAPSVDIGDPKTLDELASACDDAKTTWANLSFMGPRLNQQFHSILENFPCQDSRCAAAKSRGGGKMFCLTRFMLDPPHVKPEMLAASAHRSIQQGGTMLSFIYLFLRVFEEKRSAHSWGNTALDELGVTTTLNGMARGDVPMPSLGPGASMIGAAQTDRHGRRRREHASAQDGIPVAQPVSIASAPHSAPASENPPAPLPPRPRILHGDQYGGQVEKSTEPPDARLQSIEEAICNIGDGVTAIAERLAASAQQQQQDEEKEADNISASLSAIKESINMLKKPTKRHAEETVAEQNGDTKHEE